MKTVKISLNPFEPNHQKVGNLQLMVHAPLIKNSVLQSSHPKLTELLVDEEHPEAHVRRVLVSFMDPEIEEFEFDLDAAATHQIKLRDHYFEVSLIEIGEETLPQAEAQKFLYFIFNVNEI